MYRFWIRGPQGCWDPRIQNREMKLVRVFFTILDPPRVLGSTDPKTLGGSQEIVTFKFFFCQLKLAKMSISKRLGKLPTYAVY